MLPGDMLPINSPTELGGHVRSASRDVVGARMDSVGTVRSSA